MKTETTVAAALLLALISLTYFNPYAGNSEVAAASRLLATTLNSSKVLTSSTRTSNVNTYCAGKTRSTLITDAERATNVGYFNNLKTYIPLNGTTLITNAINSKYSQVISDVQTSGIGIAIFIIPFVIGLILSLSMWTCLCCCCTCPSCCPSKCCQQPANQEYTKCELLWPVIFLILVMLLACAAAIPGITKASIVTDSIQTTQCGVSILLDNLINGNLTNDNTAFFMGTKTTVNQMDSLKNNIVTIIDNLNTTLSTDLTNILNHITSARNSLELLPDGTTANASNVITYSNPTPDGPASLNSYFGSHLGNPTQDSTVIGTMYGKISTIYNQMDTVNTAISGLSGVRGSITGNIDTAKVSINDFNTLLVNMDNDLGKTFGDVAPMLSNVKLGTMVFFAVVIALSVLVILGAIVMSCFDKPGCRHLMYVACVPLTIITILGFLLCFVFSFIIPVMYLGCTTFSDTLKSSTNFETFATDINMAGSAGKFSVCLSGANGKILDTFGSAGAVINDNMNNIKTSLSTAQSYVNYDTTPLTTARDAISTLITDFRDGKLNDIAENSTASAYFFTLGNRSRYACNATKYLQDTIVPSTDNRSTAAFPCASGTTACVHGGAITSVDNCPTSSCIDLSSFWIGVGGSLSTGFNTRYSDGNSTCTTMVTDLESLRSNWGVNRYSGINTVSNRYNSGVGTDLNNVVASVDSIKVSFNSSFNTLNSTLNTIVDPDYGMVAGINCLSIGEDIILMKDAVCVSTFNTFYFLLLTMGITSFALLFGLCCIVCSGVRHFKQAQLKNSKILQDTPMMDYSGVPYK